MRFLPQPVNVCALETMSRILPTAMTKFLAEWQTVTVKDMFERITFDTQVMGGRACIRGMRITVSLVLSLLSNRMSFDEILEAYPYLEGEDISACLAYAAFLANEEVYPIKEAAA